MKTYRISELGSRFKLSRSTLLYYDRIGLLCPGGRTASDYRQYTADDLARLERSAALVGARSVIFVHGGVSDERVAAIARFGAEMVRVDGTYDDSVRAAALEAAEQGWHVISDTSWPGYTEIPRAVNDLRL